MNVIPHLYFLCSIQSVAGNNNIHACIQCSCVCCRPLYQLSESDSNFQYTQYTSHLCIYKVVHRERRGKFMRYQSIIRTFCTRLHSFFSIRDRMPTHTFNLFFTRFPTMYCSCPPNRGNISI